MEPQSNFFTHLEILGQLPSPEGRERALRATFGAMKALLSEEESRAVEAALPPWLRPRWRENQAAQGRGPKRDLLGLIKTRGDYGYRGAAERALRGVLGSLVEVLEPESRARFRKALPEELRPSWDQVSSCGLNATAGQYL